MTENRTQERLADLRDIAARLDGKSTLKGDMNFLLDLVKDQSSQLQKAKEALEEVKYEADYSCDREMKNKKGDNKNNPYALNQFMNLRAIAEYALKSLTPPL